MRETIIPSTSNSSTLTAESALVDAASITHQSTTSSTSETTDACSFPALPSFDTYASHTRIRIFLHSFKGAVLCAQPITCVRLLPSRMLQV